MRHIHSHSGAKPRLCNRVSFATRQGPADARLCHQHHPSAAVSSADGMKPLQPHTILIGIADPCQCIRVLQHCAGAQSPDHAHSTPLLSRFAVYMCRHTCRMQPETSEQRNGVGPHLMHNCLLKLLHLAPFHLPPSCALPPGVLTRPRSHVSARGVRAGSGRLPDSPRTSSGDLIWRKQPLAYQCV